MWERYYARTIADIKELNDKEEERKERLDDFDKDLDNSEKRVNGAFQEIDDLRKEFDDLRKDADEERRQIRTLSKTVIQQAKTMLGHHRDILELKNRLRRLANPRPGPSDPASSREVIEIHESPSPPRAFSPLSAPDVSAQVVGVTQEAESLLAEPEVNKSPVPKAHTSIVQPEQEVNKSTVPEAHSSIVQPGPVTSKGFF